jgi:pullulanase/glycogen debranching enzyme
MQTGEAIGLKRSETKAFPKGESFPLGATLAPGGANFSVFAKHSTAAQLLLFDHSGRRGAISNH